MNGIDNQRGSRRGDGADTGAPAAVRELRAGTGGRRAVRLGRRIRLRFRGAIAGEMLKLWSLGSTRWIAGVALALTVGIAALGAWSILFIAGIDQHTGQTLEQPQPVALADIWTTFGSSASTVALALAILGVMAITSEYSNAAIQSSLVANPRRDLLYLAKSIAVTVFSLAIGLVAVLLGWAVIALMTLGHDVTPLTGDQTRVLPVMLLGFPVVMALAALLALGLGGMTRSTVGGVSAAVVLLMVLPSVVSIVSIAASQVEWLGTVSHCLPDAAMNSFLSAGVDSLSSAALAAVGGPGYWAPEWWQSGLILLAWTTASWIGGLAVTKRSDIR